MASGYYPPGAEYDYPTSLLEKIAAISEDGELWKACPDFEEKYLISSHGGVMGIGTYNTCKKGALIKLHKKHGRNGYMQTRLYDNGRAKTIEIHTLVAKAFIPNPDNLPMVNHIDEDKTNNHVENLEWCDNSYNVRYSNAKSVDVYTKEGEFIETLDTITDAAEKYNAGTANISRCCKSKCGTCNGFQFRYHGQPFVAKPPVTTGTERRRVLGIKPKEFYFIPIDDYTVEGIFVKTWPNVTSALKNITYQQQI